MGGGGCLKGGRVGGFRLGEVNLSGPFEIPLVAADLRDDERVQSIMTLPSSLRVLMADDAPANCELVRIMLGVWDIALHTVSDGAEAVQAVASGAYDLVLMDVHMPMMDGLEATRAIRRLNAQVSPIPILALTANVQPEQIEACRLAGMDGHVGKPIEVAALIETMAQVLELKATKALAAGVSDPSFCAPGSATRASL